MKELYRIPITIMAVCGFTAAIGGYQVATGDYSSLPVLIVGAGGVGFGAILLWTSIRFYRKWDAL